MDKDDKKGDFSLLDTFRSWLAIQNQQNAVFILGNIAVGKTTLGHLMKRYLDNYDEPNLKLVQQKKDYEYEYVDEINPKSTKPLTIYPKNFKINKQGANFIEVPSRIYQLQPKKRPYLDKLINGVGLGYAAKKAKFLFLFDSKNTGSKFDAWKKLFQNVFDGFKVQFLNEETINSVGFLITKGTPDLTKQIYLNRMKSLYQLLNEQKRKSQYTALLDKITEQKNIQTFLKTTTEEETKNDITKIFEFVKKLPYCNLISPDNNLQCESYDLIKEEINILNQFNEQLKEILGFFAMMFKQIFQEDTIQLQNDYVKGLINRINGSDYGDISWSTVVINRHQQLMQKSKINKKYRTIIGKFNILSQYRASIMSLANEERQSNALMLSPFLKFLAKNGLILEDKDSKISTQSIYRRLIEYSIFEERFASRIKCLNYAQLFKEVTPGSISYQFGRSNEELLKRLFMSSQSIGFEDSSPQGAKRTLAFLEEYFPDSDISEEYKIKKKDIKSLAELNSFDVTNPKKEFPRLYKLLNESLQTKLDDTNSKRDFSKSLALRTAQMLKSLEKEDLCVYIFKECGEYKSALECYEKILFNQQQIIFQEKTVGEHIKLLIQMSRQDKAIEKCYQYAQIFKKQAPLFLQTLLQLIIEARQSRNKPISPQFKEIFLGKKTRLINEYISQDLLSKIKKQVDGLQK